MRAAIGSQCKLINRGVTCIIFGSLKMYLAAAFWINCKGLIELAGKTCQVSIAIDQPGRTCGTCSFFRCLFSLSNILVIIINYISFESLKPQNSSCENHFEIGYCITMEMVL